MKKINLILLAAVAVSSALISGCSKSKDGGAPVDLKLKWQVGKRYANHLTMSQISHSEIPGLPNPVEQVTSMTQDLAMSALKARPDGRTEMAMEFTALKIESKVAGAIKLSFDSQAEVKNDDQNAAVLRQLVGADFGYELDAAGKAGNVTGMDEFMARVPAGNGQAQRTLKSLLSEDLVKQLAMRGQGLPDHPVRVGDQWPMQLDENAGPAGIFQMEMKYTFKGWEDHDNRKCALVEFSGELALKPGPVSSAAALSVEKGTVEGKIWIDPEMGMVVDTVNDQSVTLKIVAQGKTIHSEMSQHVTMKLAEVTALAK